MDREADQLSRIAAGSDNPAKFDEAAKTLGLKPFKVTVDRGRARGATTASTCRA